MEPDYCPTCGDIMEPDDVTGEVRCANEEADVRRQLKERTNQSIQVH